MGGRATEVVTRVGKICGGVRASATVLHPSIYVVTMFFSFLYFVKQ